MWSEDQWNRIREHLLGAESDGLIQFMRRKSLMEKTDQDQAGAAHLAAELDWTDGSDGPLTPDGQMAADSCREYSFWLERDKALPFEGAAPHLTAAYFRDRKVMEIGPGMGANMLSLSAAGADVCGIEPVGAYRQMGMIFAEREGFPTADTRSGQAEQLPFADNELDTVLCVTSHQYFDLDIAIAEIVRVLRPGGELIIVGGTLGVYCVKEAATLFHGMSQAKSYVMTIVNTLSYTVSGRRLLRPRQRVSTSRPIYPSRRAMRGWLTAAGLREISPVCAVGTETCFHFVAEGQDWR